MTFKKGNAGRPKGSRNKKLELLRSSDVRLQKKLVAMALSGDIGALKIIADRLWPRLRAEAAHISIDVVSNDIAEQGRAIIDAALSGKITTDVGRDLLASLYAQAKIIEAAQFEARIKTLEQHHDIAPWEIESGKPEMHLVADQEPLPIRGKNKRRRKLK